MNYDENNNIIHEIIPKFNFIYELGMPTGKKIRNSVFLLILFLLSYIAILLNNQTLKGVKIENYTAFNIAIVISVVGIVFSVLKLVIHIIFQIIQYKNITFKFFKDHMVYEDSFLNQHKKNIEYQNIKEVEIRRTIWDRMLGYGIIIIYTNAENGYSNGLVIFGIKNPREHYDIIDKLVHNKENRVQDVQENDAKTFNNVKENNNDEDNQTSEEFLDSLKKIEK